MADLSEKKLFKLLDKCLYFNRGQSAASVEKSFRKLEPLPYINVIQMLHDGRVAGRYTVYVGTGGVEMWKKAENFETEEEAEDQTDSEEEEHGAEADTKLVIDPPLDPEDQLDQVIMSMQQYFVEESVKAGIRIAAIINESMAAGQPIILPVFMAGGKGSGKSTTGKGYAKAYVDKFYQHLEGKYFYDTLIAIGNVEQLNRILNEYRAIVIDECDVAIKNAKSNPVVFQMIMAIMQFLGNEKVEQSTLLIMVGYETTFEKFVEFDIGYARRFCLAQQVELHVRPDQVAKKCINALRGRNVVLADGIDADVLGADPKFAEIALYKPDLEKALWMQLAPFNGVMSLTDIIAAATAIYEFDKRVVKDN